jgi:hypothetical protein
VPTANAKSLLALSVARKPHTAEKAILAIDSFKCQGGCHDQLWHFTPGSCDAPVSLY